MKMIFTTAMIIVTVVFFSTPGKTFAATGDTLVVYASGLSLDEIINSDTTSNGLQAHGVYKLEALDTTYLYLGPITVKSDLAVIGVPGSNGRLPCIQPGILSDGSMPAIMFVMNGHNTKGVFKNLYLFGLSTTNSWNWGKDFLITANNINLYLDNVVVDENRGEIIAYSGMHDNFFITNSKFRNGIYPSSWFSSNVLVNDWPTNNPADTIIMKYNTVFCLNSRTAQVGTTEPLKYFEFSHNSIVYSFTGILGMPTVLSAKVDNNIFYSVYAAGGNPKLFLPKNPAVLIFDAVDSTTDLTRTVEVKNNVYFQPKGLTDFWTAWNTTAGPDDSVYFPTWMGDFTKKMFTNKTRWPGFFESGNLVNVDPGFGHSILNVLDNADGTPGAVGLLKYIELVRKGTISTEVWDYKPQTVVGDYWIPQWPLPELADMQYSNAQLKIGGTDGRAIGDPGWFTGGYTDVKETPTQVPSEFALYDAYPNPFNPSTHVKFSLPIAGFVSLKIYNVMGQLVKTIVDNNFQSQGEHEFNVKLDNFASGMYLCTLTQGSLSITKKMILMK